MKQKLQYYRNNFFQLLENIKEQEKTSKAKKTIKKPTMSGWQKLKELYPKLEAVEMKIKEAKEKGLSEGYIKVLEKLKKYWQKHKKL